jgi:hypothetical protein
MEEGSCEMAEQRQSDPSKAGTIAQQIVTILIDVDSETRFRAIQAAMMLLGETRAIRLPLRGQSEDSALGSDQEADLAEFFNRDDKLKPSDYAYLCAAYHFATYGASAFSLDELRNIAKEAGVVLPDRLDMTLKQAGKAGKRLFQAVGRDTYKPTASAGVFFKERWNVKPGKKAKDRPTVNE